MREEIEKIIKYQSKLIDNMILDNLSDESLIRVNNLIKKEMKKRF
jgi:hypothetical protein